jgi:hypothetical protein
MRHLRQTHRDRAAGRCALLLATVSAARIPRENLGVWEKYGYTGKIIALLRGASTHWAHPHAASKLIRRSMDLLPDRYQIVTATVDAAAGEIGIIYQACGFDYVGVMRPGSRTLTRINGKTMSERGMYCLAGTRGARALAKLGFDAISVPRRPRQLVPSSASFWCWRSRVRHLAGASSAGRPDTQIW